MTPSIRSKTGTLEAARLHQTACGGLRECNYGIEVRLGGDGRTLTQTILIKWQSGDDVATTARRDVRH
jgi:hypothetical protein